MVHYSEPNRRMALTRKMRAGEDVGDFAYEPQVEFDDEFYLSTFLLLSKRRAFSQSGIPARIPIAEIVAICNLLDIDDLDQRAEMLLHIDAMDDAWCDEIGDLVPKA